MEEIEVLYMYVFINQEPNVTHILRRVSFTSMTLKWKWCHLLV